MSWSGLSPKFAQALGRQAELVRLDPQRGYVLDLPQSWELLRAHLKRNIRESLRHCYNSLKRDGLEFRLLAHTEATEGAAALERFFELHALRAQLGGSSSHADRFKHERAREFLLDVCAKLAACNVTRVFELDIGGQVVSKTRWSPREVPYEHTVQFCSGRRTHRARLLYQLACGERLASLTPLLRRFRRQGN